MTVKQERFDAVAFTPQQQEAPAARSDSLLGMKPSWASHTCKGAETHGRHAPYDLFRRVCAHARVLCLNRRRASEHPFYALG
jgi:hypothetical protein